MTDFRDWLISDVRSVIEQAIDESVGSEGYAVNRDYIEEGDYWRDGKEWVGPGHNLEAAVKTKVLASVEPQYTPVPVCGEVVGRVANTLTKREADVTFTPLKPAEEGTTEHAAQQKEIEEKLADLSEWWDRKRLWDKVRQAIQRSAYAGRGCLRAWVAPSALVRGADGRLRLPTGLSFREALAKVEVSAPEPDAALLYENPDTLERCAVIAYQEETATKQNVTVAEIWWVEGDIAVMRKIRDNGSEPEVLRVPLSGFLPLAEMVGSVLITEPVRRQQRRLNFFESLLVRVAETGGFPERYTINAEANGVWLDYPPAGDANPETAEGRDGETLYLHTLPRTLGSSITTDLIGKSVLDKDGNETLMTPGVVFRDPTDPDFAIKAATHARGTILWTCKQGHLAGESTAEASGTAYEQARTDHVDDADARRASMEGMLRDFLSAVVRFGELMSAGPRAKSFLSQYRVSVVAYVSPGPASAAVLERNLKLRDAGVISSRTAMLRSGVEDVDAELATMEQDPMYQMRLKKERLTLLGLGINAGLGVYAAAIEAGYTPERAREMERNDHVDGIEL
jgi:hypothetical protein